MTDVGDAIERVEAWLGGDETWGFPEADLRTLLSLVPRWLPIEDAPKDGTRVLLWIEPTGIAMPFEWEDGRWMGDDFPLNMAWPTHWMPLPDPPVKG